MSGYFVRTRSSAKWIGPASLDVARTGDRDQRPFGQVRPGLAVLSRARMKSRASIAAEVSFEVREVCEPVLGRHVWPVSSR